MQALIEISNQLVARKECCGCEACAGKCPKEAITMVEDQEGFLYPVILEDRCISCQLCTKVCPVLQRGNLKIKEHNRYCYAGYLTDAELKDSASGGAGHALAKAVLKAGGEVYGVAYSKDFKDALFIKCTQMDELTVLKGSKYIQSKKGKIYSKIEESLKKGKHTMVFGLPCEIAAVKSYFEDRYSNLYTCELICHGPTSAKIQREYVHLLEKKYKSTIVNFNVRYKKEGCTPPYLAAEFENGTRYEKNCTEQILDMLLQYLSDLPVIIALLKEITEWRILQLEISGEILKVRNIIIKMGYLRLWHIPKTD